ncbi:hypothetical protein BJ508DRAFT_417753 [Ascobolus immersus RN42]|uniref:Uncharacterized protein n=1 Tax=Ascobolus immersus RN42 TaxID=1160509 RepID=A0A3N4HRV4_ASCIM|nr:hypothetical protein BJ508DRAFT_417753 [Ascobolus immersus RN42]
MSSKSQNSNLVPPAPGFEPICHVCIRMFASRPEKFTHDPSSKHRECVLCARDFCERHASIKHMENKAEFERYPVCEINHETYWRNHNGIGSLTPFRTVEEYKENCESDTD